MYCKRRLREDGDDSGQEAVTGNGTDGGPCWAAGWAEPGCSEKWARTVAVGTHRV